MTKKSGADPAPSTPANAKPPDIASASVPDALAALHVNPDTGLTPAKVTPAGRNTATTRWPKRKGARS